VRYMYPQ